jgi:hypothetical protein
MPSLIARLSAALPLACGCALVHAARPFVTDDARIVDPGGYQIESFFKHQRNVREDEFWFLPAWNPRTSVELTLGGFLLRNAEEGRASTLIAQAKTLLRPLQANDFGLAVTVGALRQNPLVSMDTPRWSPFVNLIGSRSWDDDVVVVHANAGFVDDRIAAIMRYTWGLGGEIAAGTRLWAILETYSQEGEKPSSQIGLRYWVVQSRLQVDTTLGRQHINPQNRNWVSIGVRILF